MITYIVIPYRKTADNNALYSILQTLKTVLENNSEAVFFTRKQLNALFQAVLRQSKRTSTFYQNWRPDMAAEEGFEPSQSESESLVLPLHYSALFWCEGRDLNSQGKNHTPLKRARLPIPPPSHSGYFLAPNVYYYNRIIPLCQQIFIIFYY